MGSPVQEKLQNASFAASEWTKLKSLLDPRVPSSCKSAEGHSNLTISMIAWVIVPMNSMSRQCLWTWQARPAGHCNCRPYSSLLSKLLSFPRSNTFVLDNWDLGVSRNNQCSFEIHSFFLPRKGQIHPCSWCRLWGDGEWFISTVKWSVLQDMKYCCSTRKPLDCLFSFTLLNFLIQKLPMLVITNQTGSKPSQPASHTP